MARTPRSQVSTSAPKDKPGCVSQIAERHVTVARCDVRSAVCDQQEANVAPLPESDTGRTRQQGSLHQFGNNAKWPRSSGPGVNSQSHGAMFVAVHHQGLACKETDSALNSGLQSKRTNAISLTKQETRKDTDGRQGGRERKKDRGRERKGDRKCTW